jgi:leader peptidase (prepilin peptidase)/N-methyltransferase
VLWPEIAAVGCAALIGAAGPWVIRRLPEPEDAPRDKRPYAQLGQVAWLWAALALLAALLMATVAAWTHEPAALPTWALVAGVGAWLAYIDARTRLLPYLVVVPTYIAALATLAICAVVSRDARLVVDAVIASAVVYLVFRVLFWLGERFFSSGLGYGDVRLGALLGLALGALGASQVIVGVYAGFVLGAVLGVGLARFGLIDPRQYAFGPYLIVGAVIGAVWGPSVLTV